MIKLTIMYPNTDGTKFDMDYYLSKHMPLVKARLGGALKNAIVEQGIGGSQPGTKATYRTICHLFFDSPDAMSKALAPHRDEILGDVPKFTDSVPISQLSEVKM